jgi:hypothetical protein
MFSNALFSYLKEEIFKHLCIRPIVNYIFSVIFYVFLPYVRIFPAVCSQVSAVVSSFDGYRSNITSYNYNYAVMFSNFLVYGLISE